MAQGEGAELQSEAATLGWELTVAGSYCGRHYATPPPYTHFTNKSLPLARFKITVKFIIGSLSCEKNFRWNKSLNLAPLLKILNTVCCFF